jgi:hypothetical protein
MICLVKTHVQEVQILYTSVTNRHDKTVKKKSAYTIF